MKRLILAATLVSCTVAIKIKTYKNDTVILLNPNETFMADVVSNCK